MGLSSSDQACRRELLWPANLSASGSDDVRTVSPDNTLGDDTPVGKGIAKHHRRQDDDQRSLGNNTGTAETASNRQFRRSLIALALLKPGKRKSVESIAALITTVLDRPWPNQSPLPRCA